MVTLHRCFSYFCKCISFFFTIGQFCCIQDPKQCVRSGDSLLLCTDEALMQEKLFCMTQVGPGQVHTLCLGSPCCTGMVMMSGDWYGALGWRVREKLLRTGKTSIWGLVLDCPCERVVYAGLHCTNSSLVAKPRAVSPWLAAAAFQPRA